MDKEINNYYEPSIKTSRNEILKAIMKLPKVEANNPISTMNGINVDELMSAVDRFDKVPTYDELLRENKKQKEVIDKATETLEKEIIFCENDSQGIYDKCNIAINREKKILDILKEVSE